MSYSSLYLDEIADFTNGGAWKASEYVDDGVPVVRVSDFTENTIDISQCKFLPWSSYEKYSKHILHEGDLVIATVGSHPTQPNSVVGRPVIVPKDAEGALLNQNAVRLEPKKDKIRKEYLGYLGLSPFFRNYVIANARGSANQVRMSLRLLKKMEIQIPEIKLQDKIVNILDPILNKIDNNHQKKIISEAIAENLFQEWFVHHRYPGFENDEIVETKNGKKPKKWQWKKLGEVSKNFDRKRIPLSKLERTKRKGNYPYYGAARILDYIDSYIFDGRYLLFAEDGSVITEKGHPVLQLVDGKFWANNHTHVLQGNHPISTNYLYLYLSKLLIQQYITGAAQPKINQKNLNDIPVLIPSNEILLLFDYYIRDIFDYTQTLDLKMELNIGLRDLLLPKLLSGEIDLTNF